MMKNLARRVLLGVMATFAAAAFPPDLTAQEHPLPVCFTRHCGGKARYAIPKAMGFSPDSRLIGVVYGAQLILLELPGGREVQRIRTAAEFHRVNYNYVAFDPAGERCCICQLGYRGVLLQFFRVREGVGSKAVYLEFDSTFTPADPSDYRSTGSCLPLRPWLSFQQAEHGTECAFQAAGGGTEEASERFRVSLRGDSLLETAEQLFVSLGGEQEIRRARHLGAYTGAGMQVALSRDQRILLAQFLDRDSGNLDYRFVFYDVLTNKKLTEIKMPTGIDWRLRGSRGFAFSPDFRRLARTLPGGRIIVHDLSAIVERRLADANPITISLGYDEERHRTGA